MQPACSATRTAGSSGWTGRRAGYIVNIDDLTLACPPDNQMIEKTDWATRKNSRGHTEWLPPPDLDTGQARTNNYHHPERYLLPEDDEGP